MINIFQSSATESHTGKDPKYNDADFMKGGYDLTTNKLMAAIKIAEISGKMKTLGLHQPTLTTLQDVLTKIYNFTPQSGRKTFINPNHESAGNHQPFKRSGCFVEAKQDRDTQDPGQ